MSSRLARQSKAHIKAGEGGGFLALKACRTSAGYSGEYARWLRAGGHSRRMFHLSDMAFSLTIGNRRSSCSSICAFALLLVVFLCSFSRSSAQPTYWFDQSKFYASRRPSSEHLRTNRLVFAMPTAVDDLDGDEYSTATRKHVVQLMLKAALLQADARHHPTHANNRRYSPQGFHAMRG